MEVKFSINNDDWNKVFLYQFKKSKFLKKILLLKMSILPFILLFILSIRYVYICMNKQDINLLEFIIVVSISIFISIVWTIISFFRHKKYIKKLALLEAEKMMEGKKVNKYKISLYKEFIEVNCDNYEGKVFYKGIKDVIILNEEIVILIYPFKLMIIPKRAFNNIESRKSFVTLISNEIKKSRIVSRRRKNHNL
ncbi:YcxB family protein [Clostridium fallax]|uniref:YcxB-like protein n=1 Tax=Clostridium fallax TaxID=1533 RepID=A0A1M4U788_9CLOT|nr:YcxB family protein [Clostridium fallax]SHE52513.1 hypothetical protein SAMN05443638_10468 [Clostridium fallax]SQB06110.1 Uncharacterised protein [Clostridium fallax]